MIDALNTLESTATAQLASAADATALETWRLAYLGNSGKLKAAMAGLKDVPKDQKPAVGQRLNQVKATLEAALDARKAALGPDAPAKVQAAQIDMTEPGLITSSAVGRRHILTRVRDELVDVFARMGFAVADGPELEDDEHNFAKLNIPQGHPARDPIDNFYVDDPRTNLMPRMLRSQTSTVQIRVLEDAIAKGWGPPVKIVSPGRVYRPDTVDATHSFMFHQIEGLYVDRGVSMADLKTTLFQFVRAYFGSDAEIRFTPTFYPFTEPSAQFEINVRLTPDSPKKWMELGGCGMVDPAVFQACGIDPEQWTGFAFGFGVERLAMSKYGIPDIRLLFGNDVRFLAQL